METVIRLKFEGDNAKAIADKCGGVDVSVLLRDAIGEFIATRGGKDPDILEYAVAEYVTKRYAGSSKSFMQFKLRDVLKRIAMADLLKRAEVTIETNALDEGEGR